MSNTNHARYLRLADGAAGLTGKRILEVGGSSPPGLVASFKPQAWTSVNLNRTAVEDAGREARENGDGNYAAHLMDIAEYSDDGGYDLVYSINCFEHISRLREGIDRMYELLRPGGKLFTIFGPIWSADVGHHLSLASPEGELHFASGVLEPWEHLTSTPEQLREKLAQRYSVDTAARAVDFIYDYPDLNRLTEQDYLDLVDGSRFSRVLVLKKRHGKPPPVAGASSTRELMLLLKKGRPNPFERITHLAGFALAYLRTR